MSESPQHTVGARSQPGGFEPSHPQDVPDQSQRPEQVRSQRHVVVGVDGSPQCRAALDWALRYADAFGLAVRAVAVWYQPAQFADAGLAPTPVDFEAEARRWLADALPDGATDDPSPRVETRIEQGKPAHVLLDQAQTAEMIVLGNHGRGALGATLLGSVAQRCAQHAKCPVVLVPTSPA